MTHTFKRSFAIAIAAALLSTTAIVQTASAAPNAGDPMTMTDKASTNAVFNKFLNKYGVQQGDISLIRYSAVTADDKAALEGYIETLSKAGAPNIMSLAFTMPLTVRQSAVLI